MARKQIVDLIEELRSWLPNYDHGPMDYPTVLYRVLAALPGGDELEDMGYEPIGNLGWQEVEQLGKVLETIQDKRDVEDLIAGLTKEEGEEANEMRESGRVDRNKIQQALAYVHHHERSSSSRGQQIGRAEAAKQAIRVEGLNDAEVSILLNALHVRPEEVGEASVGETREEGRAPAADHNSPETTESHELALYTINDGDIYRQTIQPIIKNLARKVRNGTYNKELAVKAWAYAADAGAQKYTKEFGGGGANGSYGSFSKADRMAAAREIGEQYEEEVLAAAKVGRPGTHEAGEARRTGGTRGGPPRKYYVVFQVQNGLWYQVGHFAEKSKAEKFRKTLSGKTKLDHTWPSRDYPVIAEEAVTEKTPRRRRAAPARRTSRRR